MECAKARGKSGWSSMRDIWKNMLICCMVQSCYSLSINKDDCLLLAERPTWTGVQSCNLPGAPTCKPYTWKDAHPHDYGQQDGIYCDASTGRVRKIALAGASITGQLPTSWSLLPSVRAIFIINTQVSGTIPESWGRFAMLVRLDILDSPQLTGTLPESATSWEHLEYLDIRGTALQGTLPSSWSSKSKLKFLYLANNYLRGTLPASWGNKASAWNFDCGGFEQLSLAGNQLSGTLPSSWGPSNRCVLLLNLAGNKLDGTLPSSWSAMQVEWMFLDGNPLHGTIPSGWTNMISLQALVVTGTRLCGAIPAGGSLLKAITPKVLPACQKSPAAPSPKLPVPKSPSPKRPVLPSPKPPAPRPPSPIQPHPQGRNETCGPWFSKQKCTATKCCSRWGWCGNAEPHCNLLAGCQAAYGTCKSYPSPPSGYLGYDTDQNVCGAKLRCAPGYCCNEWWQCSPLATDCNTISGCRPGYGMCYNTQDELQSGIDSTLNEQNLGPEARAYASTTTSNATLLSLYSFYLPSASAACAGSAKSCKAHVVKAGESLQMIASYHGTTTWQLVKDNDLLLSGVAGVVQPRPNDVLAVNPSPGVEGARWQWSQPAALLLGKLLYPRPCMGYTGEERKLCFCHYHPPGVYVWPFSDNALRCRETVTCNAGNYARLQKCRPTAVADDSADFSGRAACVPKPENFECSTGEGCTSVMCICKEFQLRPGSYLNPFDSTRSTGILCDWSQEGWFGGLIYCAAGAYFHPQTKICMPIPMKNSPHTSIPYRKGYTSCDGVPDPDLQPASTATGRRLLQIPFARGKLHRPCNKKSCCSSTRLALARKYSCLPCSSCKDGAFRLSYIVGQRKCKCVIFGSCPLWFNMKCKWKKT